MRTVAAMSCPAPRRPSRRPLPLQQAAARALVALLLLAAPLSTAHAGLTLAASVGYGYEISPDTQTEAGTLMVAPGYQILDFLRPELGIVGTLDAARYGRTDGLGLELRPMLVLSAPLLPLYARLVGAFVHPFADDRTWAYGGALGAGVSLLGLGAFAELGVLPRSIASRISWVLEGRLGLKYAF